jgi:hypothetical protein
MIECKIGKDVRCNITASGSTTDLATDILLVVNAIYNSMKDRDPIDADMFRLLIGLQISSDSFWSIQPEGEKITIAIPRKKEPEVE